MKKFLVLIFIFTFTFFQAQDVVPDSSSAKLSQDFLNKLDSLGGIDSAANAQMKYNKGVELMDLKKYKDGPLRLVMSKSHKTETDQKFLEYLSKIIGPVQFFFLMVSLSSSRFPVLP